MNVKKGILLGGLLLAFIESPILVQSFQHSVSTEAAEEELTASQMKKQALTTLSETNVILDVPFEHQLSEPALENGCEVTALAMVLNYYDYKTDKNELADQLNYVPLITEKGNYGNPHEGFVGNIYEGNETMGIAVEPIGLLAERYVGDDYQVSYGSSGNFNQLLAVVEAGSPVWFVTTIDFDVPEVEDFRTWQTDDEELFVTSLIHAAVITGYDETKDLIYVNDPNGEKNQAIDWQVLQEIFIRMGGQYLYLSND